MKSRNNLIFTIGLLLTLSLTASEHLRNFKITYVSKNPDGKVTSIKKYYLLDGKKFRVDYISANISTISVSTGATANLNGDVDSAYTVKKEIKDTNEQFTDLEPHTIEILLKDKKLVWSLDPSFKEYREVPLRNESWDRLLSSVFMDDLVELKKTGETTILNCACGIYENVQKVKDETWTNIFYLDNNTNVILKSELLQNGKLVQLMEAAEFNMNKPAEEIFRIPKGYNKNKNN